MANKYRQFDQKLFLWLETNRKDATTAAVIQALGIKNKTEQRHISRRFTQLEDRGVLKCSLRGTTRICTLVGDLPDTMEKKRWRPGVLPKTTEPENKISSIPASNSFEFERLGGIIEKLPSRLEEPMQGSQPLGPSYFDDID